MLVHLKARWDTRAASQIRNLDAMLFIERARAAMRQRRRRRAAIAELEAMDDYLLSDIGISRAEIPDVVEGMIAASRAAAPEPLAAASEAPLRQAA